MQLGRVAAALSNNASALRSFLRSSPSLQDLSTYPRPDLELGSPGPDPKPAALSRENGSSAFPKPPPPVQFLPWRRNLRTGVCISSALVLLMLITYAVFSYFRIASNYYVVIDCGSTGTRVYVYQWSVNRSKGNGVLPITLQSLPEGKKWKFRGRSGRAYRRMETEPGFDKLVRNETGLKTAMMPLLRWAERQIPRDAHVRTSVFLYATAGVRRLPKSDSDWLLEKAWLILKNSKFLCRKEWVKIISGMEEAYYGWISLNHHMGVLGSFPEKGTFGSLDLGGSSLQVTFENEDAMHDETGLRLSIGSVNHNLNAYSLAGYGLNDAFDKSVVHLLKRFPAKRGGRLKDGSVVLKHPCLHSGYKERYVCSRCSALNHDGSRSSVGGNNGKRRTGVPVKLLGDPNWGECSSLAKAVVNLSEWSVKNSGMDCDIRPCALTDKFPRPRGRFYAMSGFFVVFKFFNLSSDATIEDMLHKGHGFCSKSWQAAKNSVSPQPYIEQYCFRAPYIASLLRNGLHIGDTQVVIGSGSITWTLGVALLEAGQATSNRMDMSAYNFLQAWKINYTVFLLVIAVLLLCFLSYSGKWRNKILRRSPLPLFRQYKMASAKIFNRASYFGVHGWSSHNSGDEKVKLPLSPKVAGSMYSLGSKHSVRGGSVHLPESSMHVSASGLSRSYSGGLGQTHSENAMGSFWPPHRNQMQIQSRRSLSREDLNSPLSEVHMVKS